LTQIFKAIRTALGSTYLGDSKLAKALFAAPSTFDDRVISLLQGLGQTAETPANTSISGADIKACLAAIHATSNADRIAALQKIPYVSSERIILPANGFSSILSGAGVASQYSTEFNGHIRRVTPLSWALSISSKFPAAGVASAAQYAIHSTRDLSPLFYSFCLSAFTASSPNNKASGLGAYSNPPIPIFPNVSFNVIDLDCYMYITPGETVLTQVAGKPCDFSCNLSFDLSP
jgi:hypothetical protein